MRSNATLGCLLSMFVGGCAASTVPAASAQHPSEDVALTEPAPHALPPDSVDVAWQDNGVPIRPLSAPGRERELAEPVVASQHRGSLSVAPPSNSTTVSSKKNSSQKK